MPFILMPAKAVASEVALELTEAMTWNTTGFLEVSQMMTWTVPIRELRMDTYLTWRTPGVLWPRLGSPEAESGEPTGWDNVTGQVLTLEMSAGGVPVESFNWSTERGSGTRMDVTLIGDDRGADVPPVSVNAAGQGGTFAAAGTLPEWELERAEGGAETTSLHASDKSLEDTTTLPELVPWEIKTTTETRTISTEINSQSGTTGGVTTPGGVKDTTTAPSIPTSTSTGTSGSKSINAIGLPAPASKMLSNDASAAATRAHQVSMVPVAQRDAARTDRRRMPVDQVVMDALGRGKYRLLAPPPFPGYDFRAFDDGPSYSTLGKTRKEVVDDIWGKVGYQTGYEDGYLVIRGPEPTGDYLLSSPVASERIERITLDAPSIELEGGESSSDGSNPDSPDPDERDGSEDGNGDGSGDGDGNGNGDGNGDGNGLQYQKAPTPQLETAAAYAVPLRWTEVKGAFQYILERIEGSNPSPYALWSRVAILTATRYTDDTVLPLHTYRYRLQVNATAAAGTSQNTVYLPSDYVEVTTPAPDTAPPGPVTDLEGYFRDETSVGIRWKAPKADPADQPPPRHDAALRYEVKYYSLDKENKRLLLLGGSGDNGSLTWKYQDGFPVGAKIEVIVVAINASGRSEEVSAYIQLVNLKPAPIGEVKLDNLPKKDGIGFKIAWDKVAGGVYYGIEWGAAEEDTKPELIQWTASDIINLAKDPLDSEDEKSLLYTTWDVKPSTRYAVRVRASNSIGAGGWSEVAYIVTEDKPPKPEPDPDAAAFEKNKTSVLKLSRKTDTSAEETTIWKQGGRVIATEVKTHIKEAVFTVENRKLKGVWMPHSTVITKNFYEITGWPLTLTATVTESIHYDVQQPGREIGREQEKVHQEWSPQGWLNLKRTERRKAAWVNGEYDKEGKVKTRTYQTQSEVIIEQWQPVGDGLWLYRRTTSGITTRPLMVRTLLDANGSPLPKDEPEGDWEGMESAPRSVEPVVEVTDQAPPQATLPEEEKEKDKEVPPLPRNEKSAALGKYPLDEPWFTTPDPKAAPPENEGPSVSSGGDDGKGDGDPDPPKGPNDPEPTPGGSGDPTGAPEPDEPTSSKDREIVTTKTIPDGHEIGNGASISTSIPWIRTKAGLEKYAAMLAKQGGPRYRITRAYILPCEPPSLDMVVSASASGSYNQFEMGAVTESLTPPD